MSPSASRYEYFLQSFDALHEYNHESYINADEKDFCSKKWWPFSKIWEELHFGTRNEDSTNSPK